MQFFPMIIGKCVRKAAIIAVIAVGLPSGSIAAYCGVLILSGNLHAVEEGQVYRSAQLDTDEFESAIKTRGIKSILNLRGRNEQSPWYREEIAVAAAHGITHYDRGLSAKRPVTQEQMRDLVELVRNAPKPLLIHCRSGADRSGLVAALYRYAIQGKSADDAAAELSLRYGHFPWLTSKSGAMDQSLAAWEQRMPPSTAGGS